MNLKKLLHMPYETTTLQGTLNGEASFHGPVAKDALDELRALFTVRNPEYENAVAYGRGQGRYGLPPQYLCYLRGGTTAQGPLYAFPREARHEVAATLLFYDYTIEWDDRRTVCAKVEWPAPPRTPMPVQRVAIDAWLDVDSGCIVAPAGAGKTTCGLIAGKERGYPVLWLTHTTELANQTAKNCVEVLGLSGGQIGRIGGGSGKKYHTCGSHVTVAMLQTVKKMSPEELRDLEAHHGTLIFDEMQHAPASGFFEVVSMLAIKHRLGLTATDRRRDKLDNLMFWALGPVVSRMTPAMLPERLIKPTVVQMRTGNEYEEIEGTDAGAVYQALVNAVVEDDLRNKKMMRRALMDIQGGHLPIMLTTRVEHVVYLLRLAESRGVKFGVLTGKVSRSDRDLVLAGLDSGDIKGIIATTGLIGEGFDYPRLDRLHLCAPVKWNGAVEQFLGRISRVYPGKEDAIVYDWCDEHAMLWASWKHRYAQYKRMDLTVVDSDGKPAVFKRSRGWF